MLDKKMYTYVSDEDEKIFTRFLDDETDKLPFECTAHTIQTESGSTYILESGEGITETLLWLHGYGLNAISGKNILRAFGKKYRVIAPDVMWQAGRSVPNYPINRKDVGESYGKWLLELLDHYKLEKTHIIGLSFGAWIATSFALNHADRLLKIILLSPSAVFAPLRMTLHIDQIRAALFPNDESVRKFVRHGYGPANEIDRFDLELLSMYLKHCKKNSPSLVLATVFPDRELSRIENPLLLVIGRDDVYLRIPEVCARVSRVVNDSKVVVLEKAAHYLQMTHFDELERELAPFLETK